MNKITLSGVTAAVLSAPFLVMAADLPGSKVTGDGITPITNLLDKIGNWMFAILIAVAAIYILLAAFDFLMAKGDSTKVAKARQALTFALVAVVVAALTKGLIAIAQAVAEGSGV